MIEDKDLISKLIDTAQRDEDVGIVGPKVLQMHDRRVIQDIGITCDMLGFPSGLHSGELNGDRYRGCVEVFGVSGCAMLVRSNVFWKVGYFDPDFFMFMEDVDLCWRARLAGFRIVANADASIYHEGGGTATGGYIRGSLYQTSVVRSYLRERNTLRTILKNYSAQTLIWILPFYSLFVFWELLLYFACFKLNVLRAYLKAFIWNLKTCERLLYFAKRSRESVG